MDHPRRLARDAYIGRQQVFLTICTHDRQPAFADPSAVELVATEIFKCAECERVEISAYCFMPDHIHALLTTLAGDSDVRRFVCASKQRSAFAYKRIFRCRLWQGSYFDRTLRQEDAMPSVMRYIVNNPLRARLVESIVDYPFWGSSTYTRAELLEFIAIETPSWRPPT